MAELARTMLQTFMGDISQLVRQVILVAEEGLHAVSAGVPERRVRKRLPFPAPPPSCSPLGFRKACLRLSGARLIC